MNPLLLSWLHIEIPEGTPRTVYLMPADLDSETSQRKAAAAKIRWLNEPRNAERGRRISEGKRRAKLLRELSEIDQKRQERA